MNASIFQGQSLPELAVRPATRGEAARYRAQMAQYHYLGDLPKIGETLWYVATWREQWVAQLSVSAAALKCGVEYAAYATVGSATGASRAPTTSSTGTTTRIAVECAGNGPQNITRLRRFAVGVLKSFQKPHQSIAHMMRKLTTCSRMVFDYLRMTANSLGEVGAAG